MSAIVAFFLGLAVGGGMCFWQRTRQRRNWHFLLQDLPSDVTEVALSPQSQLRIAIDRLNQEQQELEQTVQSWQHVLQFAPFGYLQVDEENHLVWYNREARSMLKIQQPSPDVERVLLEVVRSYELDRLIEQTRDDNRSLQQEWQFYPASLDAEELEAQQGQTLKAYSLPLAGGQVGVFFENRQPLVDLMQSHNRWVSDLAHELRTPLTSIQLVVETSIDRLEPPVKTWVERLLPEVQRLIHLVQDWLELTHLEANRSLQTQPLQLNPLVMSVWQTLEPLANRKHVRLAYREPRSIWIDGDESRLYRVFLNLLDNAVRYSPEGSAIRVEVEQLENGDRVRVHVIDCGCGFATADLPHVFDRLYRGDPGRSHVQSNGQAPTTTSGSGLGLAIVKQIVLAHGGTISAQNHPETKGAWLRICLPVAEATPS
ncbi:MAG: histidine kinase [Cyanobacteria bacterium SID2]|nr:histidine kinase [Cyanobacteria bacterium SID2]MBP0004818.1 histidine kinase [Cyanobacteria bacterium SBC]